MPAGLVVPVNDPAHVVSVIFVNMKYTAKLLRQYKIHWDINFRSKG